MLGRNVRAIVLECNGARFLDGFIMDGLLEKVLGFVRCWLNNA